MSRGLTFGTFLLALLVVTACAKGRYTDDHHYVGNPERPPATSEPIPADTGTKEPQKTPPR